MEECNQKLDQKGQFISIFLFENGSICKPEKLRVPRNNTCKFFTKVGKVVYYNSKALYTLCGKRVTSFEDVKDDSAYVLVTPAENFICLDYETVFNEMMRKKNCSKNSTTSNVGDRSKSNPCVPTYKKSTSSCFHPKVSHLTNIEENIRTPKASCSKRNPTEEHSWAGSSRASRCSAESYDGDARSSKASCLSRKKKPESCLKEHQHCVTKDKYPCCDQDSDYEQELLRQEMLKEKKVSSEHVECKPKKKKKGFFARCCPCCVRKPKPKPSCISSTEFYQCEYSANKMTQTTNEDFKVAKKCLKAAKKTEKRRQRVYGRVKPSGKYTCAEKKINLEQGMQPCEIDSKEKAKNEAEYRKARDRYRQKRSKMADSIQKALEKQLKKKAC